MIDEPARQQPVQRRTFTGVALITKLVANSSQIGTARRSSVGMISKHFRKWFLTKMRR
jgi:hypothetical protein